jgi:hypothetical protein
MFGDIFNILGQQGPDAWFDTATQLALNIARGTDGDPNPAPIERQRLEELAPLVGRHVDTLLGVSSAPVITAVNRSALTSAALAQWRPLIAPMLAAPAPKVDDLDLDANPMMAQMASTLGPLFTGFQMGSVAGHFSERAWSLAILPLPREDSERLLVVNNLASFAEAWSPRARRGLRLRPRPGVPRVAGPDPAGHRRRPTGAALRRGARGDPGPGRPAHPTAVDDQPRGPHLVHGEPRGPARRHRDARGDRRDARHQRGRQRAAPRSSRRRPTRSPRRSSDPVRPSSRPIAATAAATRGARTRRRPSSASPRRVNTTIRPTTSSRTSDDTHPEGL